MNNIAPVEKMELLLRSIISANPHKAETIINDLRIQAEKIIPEIKNIEEEKDRLSLALHTLTAKVSAVRAVQESYFKFKMETDLKTSKRLEKELDDYVKRLKSRGFGENQPKPPTQPNLF